MEYSDFATLYNRVHDLLDEALIELIELTLNTESGTTQDFLNRVGERIAETIEMMEYENVHEL